MSTFAPIPGATPRASDSLALNVEPHDAPRFRVDEESIATKPPPKARNLSRTLKRLAAAALMLAAFAAATKLAYGWWTVGRFTESTDDAYVGGDVTVMAPKVSGFIAQLAVTDNQSVHAGDLLVKLDDRDYRAALDKAEAAVAMQQASLLNLDATSHLQDAVVAQARAEIDATEAETTRTHDDQARASRLVSNGVTSAQEFQKADADYKEALAAAEKSRATLAAAERQLEVIATQKQQTQAALAAAMADRELARLNLGYTELRAPIDGTIGNRNAQVGAYAATGTQLISIVPARGLWIDANFKESQLGRMAPGSPVSVRVDLISGQTFPGHIVSIAPATGAQFSILPPENATGNFTKIVQRIAVRIQLDNEASTAGQLRPGLSVTARVDTRSNGKKGI